MLSKREELAYELLNAVQIFLIDDDEHTHKKWNAKLHRSQMYKKEDFCYGDDRTGLEIIRIRFVAIDTTWHIVSSNPYYMTRAPQPPNNMNSYSKQFVLSAVSFFRFESKKAFHQILHTPLKQQLIQ